MSTLIGTWYGSYREYLTDSEKMHNAQLVADHFKGTDWTPEALAALCGNMSGESTLNPQMYEFGYSWEDDRGYGLVQWTPRSKYWDWAVARGMSPESGDSQLARIDYEVENNIQWIAKAEFNYMTFAQFRGNTGGWSADYLTEAFIWSYERPNRTAGEASLPTRQEFARRCLAQLDWSGSGGGGSKPTPSHTIPTTSPQHETTYTVKAGDSLTKIALKYHTTVTAIANRNGIKNVNLIRTGQVLKIPVKKVNTPSVIYVVKRGDTLSGIAAKYHTTVSTLATKNGIKDKDKIYVGQRIKI